MRVPAGTAKPGPAIGQALGPLGINMMEFCKKFNEETKHIVPSTPMPCVSDLYFLDSLVCRVLNVPQVRHSNVALMSKRLAERTLVVVGRVAYTHRELHRQGTVYGSKTVRRHCQTNDQLAIRGQCSIWVMKGTMTALSSPLDYLQQ